MSIRVLLVDDHQLTRLGLKTALSRDQDIQIVGEAADGATAVELTRQLRPDVVLMDIQLPGLNGVQATGRIVQELPDVKVIMLTMYQEEQLTVEALRMGAKGYLHKDADPDELLDTIKTVAAGQAVMTRELATRMLSELQRLQGQELTQSELAGEKLTEREVILLRLVAQGRSNKEISTRVGISESRVRNQLSEIYRKIQVQDRTQAAMYAVEKGLL
ncbi:MAG: response regulator transcription factor [Chloroflexi bacterium]|nr:response regulator transcription factor [Chloroflexota bacterium]